jgi:predicted nucleic acid-binding Zn ribbon protein
MGYAERIQRQSAVISWSEIVGDVISKETKALKIDNKTLVVKVHKAAWRQQLVFLKDEILKKIETDLGQGVVEDIRFI